jgi:hypothetical protein
VGLQRGQLSLVSTTEELLGRKSSGSCLENRDYGHRDPSRWPRGTFYSQKFALTSPTSADRTAGIVCLRTQATEFLVNNNNKMISLIVLSPMHWVQRKYKLSDMKRGFSYVILHWKTAYVCIIQT